jgi:hypothetical protein
MTTQYNTIQFLLKDLDDFFYGPNFWQAGLYPQVKDLSLEQALWKPAAERHNIWEILQHINAWKWFAVESIKGNKISSMKEYNWMSLPAPPEEEKWQAEVDKSKKLHEELKTLVSNASSELFEPSKENIEYYQQVAYHDCYHTGQIGLLRAMQGITPVV